VSYVIRLAALFCCACAFLASASAEKRVALVIGNGLYGHHPRLPNVANDAAAMATLFKAAKFDAVEVKANLGVAELRKALREFSTLAAGADMAVVYFAGHGIEVDRTNYLIPVDAKLAADIDVEDETVSLDRVLQLMEPAKRLRLVMLDACRENPFARSMKRTIATRTVGRGLGRIEPATGNTLIAFATKPNAVAEDGKGANSPFTTALINHLATPGLDVILALRRVRDEVMASTGNKQEPYFSGTLGGKEIALVPAAVKTTSLLALPPPPPGFGAPKPAADVPTQTQPSEAERAWSAAKGSTSISEIEAFIRHFGHTYYGDLAKARLTQLKQAEAAKQAGEAAKRKAEDDARIKAEAEQLALQREAAKKKDEEDARIKAEAERQRLALLQRQDNNKMRAQVEKMAPVPERDLNPNQKLLFDLAAAAPPSAFAVEAWVDRPDRAYAIGQTLTIFVRPKQDAYITVLAVGASGRASVVYPNYYQRSQVVRAGMTVRVPNGDWRIETVGPAGVDLIVVIASKEPLILNLSGPFDQQSARDLGSKLRSVGAYDAKAIIITVRAR
jgi:hypothetical protein